ncbi:stage V sporulation protein B [Paraliobacillus ryukyuensis]|uniref:Stage V sporulation protein B n=1 Tax=Paraliobacillus ryukyuensis TaxID=200904 RepID=A0A366EIK3_9BACI|nr:stage V sporulation protein B [Paraliobacillus ryukyuensis]RBP01289.1 stage V sporulation protein B [Paraliobacillus ryukyuensis]
MTKQSFLKGTLILILAGLITRFLGFVNRIVVARLMGEEGVGLYNMALPTLFLIYTLSQFGLPIAISKRVAEAEANNNTRQIKKILIISLIITGTLSIIFTIGMIISAPLIAEHFLTDKRTLYPLLAITPMVPISAIASVVRGYFQGRQNMKPQSIAQVIEQIVRISCVAFFVKLLLPYGIEFAACGAMISVIIGEFISLLFMLRMFRSYKRITVHKQFFSYLISSKDTLKSLLSIALPSTGSRLVGSVSNFLEPILVSQSLAIAGVQTVIATKQYGALTGYAIPLLFFPTFITHSLAVALLPNISEAEAKQQYRLIHYRLHQAIRISFASGAIATVILTVFAEPILQYMYGTTSASSFLIMMAPFFILLYIQFPLNATLQALDYAKPAMWNNIISTVVKFFVLIVLTTNPHFGIMGAAIAMSVGQVLGTLLHMTTLHKIINFRIPTLDTIKMILLLGLSWLASLMLKAWLPAFASNMWVFLFLLTVLFMIYILLLFVLRFITKEELRQLPLFNRFVR